MVTVMIEPERSSNFLLPFCYPTQRYGPVRTGTRQDVEAKFCKQFRIW